MSAAIRNVSGAQWPEYIAERVTGALLRCPCQWGSCGHCTNGDHEKCAWLRDPAAVNGTEAFRADQADTYLANPKKFALAPVYATGTHHWRCQCDLDAHPGAKPAKPVQLDLFGEVTA